MRSFVVQIFSFFRTLCGYLSHLDVFLVARFIRSPGSAIVAETNLHCGDFSSEKVVVTVLAVFFLVLTTRHSLSFHKFERQRCLFGVENALFTCCWYLGVLISRFQFFLLNHVILCVYQ